MMGLMERILGCRYLTKAVGGVEENGRCRATISAGIGKHDLGVLRSYDSCGTNEKVFLPVCANIHMLYD
jgi:hypothetical protein